MNNLARRRETTVCTLPIIDVCLHKSPFIDPHQPPAIRDLHGIDLRIYERTIHIGAAAAAASVFTATYHTIVDAQPFPASSAWPNVDALTCGRQCLDQS